MALTVLLVCFVCLRGKGAETGSSLEEVDNVVAADYFVLEDEAAGDEDEVEEEHDHCQSDVHAPVEERDRDDHEDQHHKEDENRTGHAAAAHSHGTVDQAGQKPGQGKPAAREEK